MYPALSQLFLLLACFVAITARGGIEKYSAAASTKIGATTSLTNNVSVVAQDGQYVRYMNAYLTNTNTAWYGNGAGFTAGTFYDKRVANRVILSIDHTDSYYTSAAYTVVVSFNVTYKNLTGAFQTLTAAKQLTLTNNQTAVNKDKAVYEFMGGHELRVQVTGISITGSGITLTNAKLLLVGEVEIERYYYFNRDAQYPSADLTHCSADLLTKGEIEVRWKPIEGAEWYELEWVHINNYDGTKSGSNYNNIAASQLLLEEKIFDMNATRVSTASNYYRIPYIYERGYILYRLRAWGRTGVVMGYDVPARWSTEMGQVGSPANVSVFTNKFPLSSGGCSNANEVFLSLTDAINWQSSISYAEEGKSKAVVNFVDGSLRSRQSVTKLKSKNDVIIGETIYDFQGRPAVNILPVPTSALKIAYVPAFNLVSAGTPYLKDNFDYDQGSCAATAPTLHISTGASNYYSPSNPVLTDENKYIPDAKGYPYTQTEYTPDNTGRVRNQSGIGPDHQLGSDHETKYLYGVPEQKDLDRLFASEVGNAVRYKKNLVVDANGQASVTYMDPAGKTIATALAGATPTNVTSIASSGSVLTTYDLLTKINPADNTGLAENIDIPGQKITLQKSILVPSNGPYTFTYAATPPKFVDNCGATVIVPPNKVVTTSGTKCYNCVLDAKVSLLNECGTELFSQSISATPPGNFTVAGTQDATCPGAATPVLSKTFTPYDATNATNTAWLKTGSYRLEKSLSINQNALAAYTANYMDTLINPCLLKLSDFKAGQNLAIDLSGCGMDCSTCNAALGSYSLYSGPSCKICLTQAQYDSLKAECAELCTTVSDKCENALTMLEADVNPTGQYGEYNSTSSSNASNIVQPQPNNSTAVSSFPLSVFNETNSLPVKTAMVSTFTATGNYNPSFYTTFEYHPDWRHPYNPNPAIAANSVKKFTYLDEFGNVSYTKVVPSGPNYIPAVHTLHTNKVIQDPVTGDYKVEVKYLANLQDFLNIWETQWAASLVIYHPEYCFYEKCVVDQLSNNYDENLIENEAITDFNTYLNSVSTPTSGNQFMFPVGVPPLSGTSPYSGSIIDPYFMATGSGSLELNNIRTAMVNYMQDPSNPGSYISIWDAAYRIVHCPNATPGSVCASASMTPGYIFTTDAEWQTFKGMYQSLKQSFQDKINIQYAIANLGYNGCIGADVFDPFQYNFYDPYAVVITYNPFFFTFWFSWNFWPPFNVTNVSQYYNPEQPCKSSTYQLYSGKNPRFPTAGMLMPGALSDLSPPCYDEYNNVIPCAGTPLDVLNGLGNMMDIAAFNNCGQCPTAINFELLLKGLSTLSTTPSQLDLTNSSLPGVKLTCAPLTSLHQEFTTEMAQNLFGAGSPTTNVYWTMDNAATSGTYLKGKFTYGSSPDCNVYLQMPAYIIPAGVPGYTPSYTPFLNTYTFADAVDFCCIVYSPSTYTFPATAGFSGPGRFSGQVTVKVKSGDPLYDPTKDTFRKIKIEGYASCIDFKNCAFEPVCEASAEIKHLQNMLNALLFTSQPNLPAADIYSTTPIGLTTVPYSGFLQPSLITSLNNAIDPSTNNLSDPWFWQLVSSAGKQLVGYIKPNGVTTSKCDITLELNSGSSYGSADIIKLTGIKPSTVTAAPQGAFTAYALLRNTLVNSNNATWEVITGTVSCLSAGKCGTNVTSEFGLHPESAGVSYAYCPQNPCDGPDFLSMFDNYYLETLSTIYPSSTNNGSVFTCPTTTCVNVPGGGCTFSIFLPAGANFSLYNDVFVNFSAPNLTLTTNGNYNHFYITATVTTNWGANTFTTILDGAVSCINFPVCEACSNVGNLVVNGDFEQGNTGFYSDYTYDPLKSLARYTVPGLGLPGAATPYGKYYNVYNIKPVWSCYSQMSDHTTNLAVSTLTPPTSLPCSQSGNGKALAARSENITLNYASALPSDVWYQYVTLKPNTIYNFKAFFKHAQGSTTLNGTNQMGMVFQLYVNNVLTGQTLIAPTGPLDLIDTVWNISQCSFNAGANGPNTRLGIKCFYAAVSGATFTPPTATSNTDFLFLVDDISVTGCVVGDPNSIACEIPESFLEPSDPDCIENALNTAMEEAEYNYNFYLDTLRKSFQYRYVKACLNTYQDFFMKCYDSENNFTLYYYDGAGNLVKTVPPQGVNRLPDNAGTLAQIMLDRQNNTQTVFTAHSYASVYKYNSLNQLVEQEMPDHDGLNAWKTNNFTGVPNTQNIQSAAFNGNNGVLVSNAGGSGFLYTFNQASGAWVPVTNLTLNNLNDVVYVTTGTYYALGKDGTVLKTTNSGTSWNFMPFPNSTSEIMKGYLLPSSTEIVAFDKEGNSWTSSSAGTVWTQANNVFGFASGEKLVDVKINTGGTLGWAISSMSRIFKFNGSSWVATANNVRPVSVAKVTGDGSATIYGVGDDGSFLKSTNSGVTWTEKAIPFNTPFIDAQFYSANNGFAVTQSGDVHQVFSGGNSFLDLSPYTNAPSGVIAISANTGTLYAMDGSGTFKSYNYAAPSGTWTNLSNLPSAAYNCLSAANANYMFAGGNTATLYSYDISTDTWTQLVNTSLLGSENIISIDFKDNSGNIEGYLVTDAGKVYKYDDSANPSPLTQVSLSASTYVSVYATTFNTAFAVSSDGYIANISGTSGTETATNLNNSFRSVFVNTAGSLVAAGQNLADLAGQMNTGPASGTVFANTSANMTPPKLMAVCTGGANFYMSGFDGTVLKYNSGNNTWDTQVTGSNTELDAIDCSGNNVLAAGKKNTSGVANNQVVFSSNAGASWSAITNTIDDMNAVKFANGSIYLAGANTKLATAVWPPSSLATIATLSGVNKFNALTSNGSTNLQAVGQNGLIYGINASLNTATPENTFNPPVLNDVKWFDAAHIIAVGNNAQILVSDNAGVSWKIVSPGSVTGNLKAVDILNANTAIVVGDNNEYFQVSYTCTGPNCAYTINNSLTKPTGSAVYNDISIANNSIIVVTNAGTIYYKPAAGAFSQLTPSASGPLRSVYLVDNTFAYAVGDNGALMKINPGAPSVTSITPPGFIGTGNNLNSVYFKDNTVGYVAGTNGILAKTTDGGLTWLNQSTPSSISSVNTLNAIVPGINSNIAVGGSGGASGSMQDNQNQVSSRFYYDKMGRLVASQNSKQYNKDPFTYGYTKYDALSRVIEVGEVKGTSDIELLPNTNNGQVDLTAFSTWIANGSNVFTEITKSYYSIPLFPLPATYDGSGTFTQDEAKLRNRISYVTYQDVAGQNYNTASIFNYDAHGDVKSVYQFNPSLPAGNKFKRVDYEYDLVSGKVTNISYQAGKVDQFYHKFYYDDDNRITNVYTSKDNSIWDQDAKYFYYRHGPLSRVELGDNKVQATDYAYSIHGWVKGTNSNKLGWVNDMGQDAKPMSANSINGFISEDAMSYSLGYYMNDYQSIVPGSVSPTTYFLADASGSAINASNRNMFNRNVSNMTKSIKKFMMANGGKPQNYMYQYDQLNRLVEAISFEDYNPSTNVWNNSALNSNYKEFFSYDANGNIQTLKRYDGSGAIMDSLLYKYNNTANGLPRNTNKLAAVMDRVTTAGISDDIESGQGYNVSNHTLDNYQYDNIGNLIKDAQEEIMSIDWTMYGKIKRIIRTNTSIKPDLEYNYDAFGNRISKIVKTKSAPGVLSATNLWTYTYYQKDAQGNVMSVYEQNAANSNTLTLIEQHLYSGARLGVLSRNQDVVTTWTNQGIYERNAGTKDLEMINHLGNVYTIVSDRKLPVDDGVYNGSGVQTSSTPDGTVDYFTPDILTASDYYAFGSPMPGRQFNNSTYRYGYNGKENDNEVEGVGNWQDYGERMYNPRIARFPSLDPIAKKIVWNSPYAFAANRPIDGIDLEGAEHKTVVHYVDMLAHADGSAKIVDTKVSIDRNASFVNNGWSYAKTDIFYIDVNTGEVYQDQSLIEYTDNPTTIGVDYPKPSAYYDYSEINGGSKEKLADDADYVANGETGSSVWRATALLFRDIKAPDNKSNLEDVDDLMTASMAPVGFVTRSGKIVKGTWVMESTKGWSNFSKNYQRQITGVEPGNTLLLNGVKFDGVVGKTLVDAKGKYAFLLEKGWAQESLLKQARRQIKAANGNPIEWHFAEKEAADVVSKLFKDKRIKGITVKHSPANFK